MDVPSTETVRVLHVDDDPDFLDLAATFLERADDRLTVETATSAADGLDRLAEEHFDCVVSDHDMPGKNGIEFLKAVREEHPDLPFVLFTGKGSEEVASEAISAGVSDYLRKVSGSERYELLSNRILNHVERTRAQRNLEESESHLKHAQAVANLGSWQADVVDDRMILTPEGREIFGIDEAVLDFEGFLACVHPDDRDRVGDAWLAALDGAEYDLEFRIVTGEGELRWVRTRADVEFDEDGTPVEALGVVQDITGQKKRQRRLQEERDRREALFQNPSDAITEVEYDGEVPIIKATNETFTEIFEYESEEVVGQPVSEVLIPDQEEAVSRYEDLIDRVRCGETVDAEVRRETQRGPRDFRLRAFPIEIADGTRGCYVIYTDITERKEREVELRRYERMANTAGDMVYILDDEGCFEFVNDAAERLTGYESEELVGEHVGLIMDDADIDEGRKLIRQLLQSSDSVSSEAYEWMLRTADGDTVPCESHITLLQDEDGWAGSVGVVRDITDRKEREAQLENFTSIVSHDLRNPLNVAKGRLELAREEYQSDDLDQVASALDRMETLIEDLLELAQMGPSADDRERVDLAAVVEDCWHHVSTAEATLVVDTDLSITADRTRLQQLLENLVRNAVEHGGESVTITVGDHPDGGFYVADDGPGIPEAHRERVFERGHTLQDGGTGFGLAIVREIAEGAHDWDIHVTDSEDGGARFEVTGVESAG